MQLALDLVGWTEIPPDSAIYYPGSRISHVLIGIDVGAGELFLARQLGFHAVIAHHPNGFTGPTWEVYRYHVRQMVAAGAIGRKAGRGFYAYDGRPSGPSAPRG